MRKIRGIFLSLSFLMTVFGCYKPKVITDEKKEDIKEDNKSPEDNKLYSLNIYSNNSYATNYSINVNDLSKIKENTNIIIENTKGKYLIYKYVDLDTNETLTTNKDLTFSIKKNMNIKIYFSYNLDYYNYSKTNGELNVILMAGQSNMAGSDALVTSLSSEVREEAIKYNKNCLINYNSPAFDNNTPVKGVPTLMSGTFVNVDFGQGNTNKNFGPEVGLANYLGQNDSKNNYYIIKVACGGTNLHTEWNPDNFDRPWQTSTGSRYMYKLFTKCVNACLGTLGSMKVGNQYFKPKIKAFCWFQGESDSGGSYALDYSNNLIKLQTKVKEDYAKFLSDDFKWISAGIHDHYSNSKVVNEALRNNSDRFISETIDLELITNTAHYTAPSYLTVGECFGRELLN